MHNVTVEWSPPLHRFENVTGYRIVLVRSDEKITGNRKSSARRTAKCMRSDNNPVDCLDTSLNRSYPCIHDMTNDVLQQVGLDSCNGSHCKVDITGLEHFVGYAMKVCDDNSCGVWSLYRRGVCGCRFKQ